MKKLTAFNYIFWKSISSFAYYRELIKTKFSFSFKYFLFFSFVLGTLTTIILSSTIVPVVNKFITRFQSRALTLYPQDLIITVKDGKVSTNVVEPLQFPIPVELFTDKPGAISDQNQQYLITIDTNSQITDFASKKSIVLVTENAIVVPDNDSGYRVYPIAETQNVIIDRIMVEKIIKQIIPLFKFVIPIIIGALFVILAVLIPMTRLLSLLVLSLVLLFIAKFMHLKLNYGKIYQLGLHALTLPTLIQIFMTMFNLNPNIPFFNSILFILYMLVILAELRKSPTLRIK